MESLRELAPAASCPSQTESIGKRFVSRSCPRSPQHLAEDGAARLPFDMYDKINWFSDLCFRVTESGLVAVAHDWIGKTGRAASAEVA